MPEYSSTPLPKKLGFKAGLRIAIEGMPADVKAELKAALAECTMEFGVKHPVDLRMRFAKSREDLDDLDHIAKSLAPAGMLWISWPKKSSGVASDLDENVVRKIGLAAGLVDVKVCAITDIWSGLKFVRRIKDR
jgi:hypothetical protein